jgi:hypothetical protein
MAAMVVMLGVALLGGALSINPFMKLHNSRIGKVVRFLDGKLDAAAPDEKFVLFFGSSRFQTAVDLEVVESSMGADDVTFLNLSQPDMGPWHYTAVFRNVSSSLTPARLVVLEISPWMFNRNHLHHIDRNRRFTFHDEMDIWGTFDERRERGGLAARLKSSVVGLVPRYPLMKWIQTWSDRGPIDRLKVPVYRTDPSKAAKLKADPVFMAENISTAHLADFEFYASEAQLFASLLTELSRQGIGVCVVHPPVRSSYYSYVQDDESRRAGFAKYRKFVDGLSQQYKVVYWDTPDQCGLDESIFLDYGHMSIDGAAAFTEKLVSEIGDEITRRTRN